MDRSCGVRSLSASLVAWAVVWGGALGCGSGSPAGPGAPPVLQVGGQYQIQVALTANDCGNVNVMPLPTAVAHAAGAADFSLTHGSNTYAGHVSSDGRFTTDPLSLRDTDGSTLTVRIEGRFSTGGLEAVVTVGVERPSTRPPGQAATCRYVVRWTGRKQGSPNVIP